MYIGLQPTTGNPLVGFLISAEKEFELEKRVACPEVQ
jgi:hypothetical protein